MNQNPSLLVATSTSPVSLTRTGVNRSFSRRSRSALAAALSAGSAPGVGASSPVSLRGAVSDTVPTKVLPSLA